MTSPFQPHSGHEVKLDPDELIVTKTDSTGHITYANRIFMKLAEYPEAALLGQPHNIIRHPDMPRGVYRLMWKTQQEGREFFGVVKNYTASGNYYWVLANVTPDYDSQRKLQGYFSVRRPPSRHAIETVTPIYAQMCQLESGLNKAAAPDASVQWLLQQLQQRGFSSYESFVLTLLGEHRSTTRPA